MTLNWEGVGAVGGMLGAAAVFVSLLYLGLQIRANTTSMETSSRQAVANEFRDWIRLINEDNEVFAKGLGAYPHMPFDERSTSAMQMHDLLLFYQSAHGLFESGTLDSDVHDRYVGWVAAVSSTLGGASFWQELRSTYNEAMTDCLAERIERGGLLDVRAFPQLRVD